jgi:hypothetical protein
VIFDDEIYEVEKERGKEKVIYKGNRKKLSRFPRYVSEKAFLSAKKILYI